MSDRIAKEDFASNGSNITSGTVADARIDSAIARDSEVTAAVAAEATLARNASNLSSGTVNIARLPIDADVATLSLPASTTISTFGASLIDDADAATAIATLGLDADLATFSLPASTTISSFVAGALDETTKANFLGALGIDTDIATLSLPGSTTITSAAATVLDDTTVGAMLTTMGGAPLASPTFTGTVGVTSPGNMTTNGTLGVGGLLTASAGLTVVGQSTMDDVIIGAPYYTGDKLGVQGGVATENATLGLLYVGSQFSSGAATIDLRCIAGTIAAGTTPVTSGTILGGMHIGASTDTAAANAAPILTDVSQIFSVATENYSPTAQGNKWDFYTVANTTTTKAIAMTIDHDKTLRALGALAVTGAATLSSTLGVTGATTLTDTTITPTTGTGVAPLFLAGVAGIPSLVTQRINGTAGSPTKIINGNTIGSLLYRGQYDTTVGHFNNGATINAISTEDWSSTASGSQLVLRTTPNGTTNFATALTLDQNQSATFSQPTIGTLVMALTTTATNDDPIQQTFQDRITTTNATVTPFGTSISVPASKAVVVQAFVVARRTGGSAGAADDSAGYRIFGMFNAAGQIGTTNKVSFESQAAWDADFGAIASNLVPINVTGAANNNVTWHVTYTVSTVGT